MTECTDQEQAIALALQGIARQLIVNLGFSEPAHDEIANVANALHRCIEAGAKAERAWVVEWARNAAVKLHGKRSTKARHGAEALHAFADNLVEEAQKRQPRRPT